MTTPTWKAVRPALLLALAYFVTGRLGLMLPAFGSNITLIWLPTGIAVAALLRFGLGCWPGVLLGAFAVTFTVGAPLPAASGVAIGNTLGPLLTTWSLQRAGVRPTLDRQRDILLLTMAALLGMAVCATVGVASLSVSGVMLSGQWIAWLTWWAGDTMGVIIAAPLVFALTIPALRTTRFSTAEFVTWLCITAVVTWAVFIKNDGADRPLALSYIPLTLVAWAALRYGSLGTSVALIVISFGAAYGTALERGPFSGQEPIKEVIVLWLFMASAAALGWVSSALHGARVESEGMQRLLEQALSDVSLGVTLTGMDRRITYVNQGCTRLTGYTATELLGESYVLLQGPETDPATAARLLAALEQNVDFEGELLNYRKDGTPFWNALLISPAWDERGKQTGFLGIQRDISKQKQAELAMRASEAQYRTLARSVPVGIFRTDAEGNCTYVNDRWLEMMEMNTAQALGRGWVDALHPDDRDRIFAAWDHAAHAGIEYRGEHRLQSASGRVTWVQALAAALRNDDGKIIGYLGSITDVTERRRAQARSEGERAVLELLASGAPLSEVLDRLARTYEEIFPGMFCSVLLLDEDGEHLRHGAAPSLPAAFCASIDGVEIGPRVGSCGTAAYTRQTTLVADIEHDPLWSGFEHLALDYGLRACWSVPVISSQAHVLGTLAVYSRQTGAPSPEEIAAIERGAQFAGLALERIDLLRSLHESQARLETLVANLPGMAYRCRNGEHWTMTYVSEGCEAITGFRRDELEGGRDVTPVQFIHTDDRARVVADWERAVAAHETYQGEYRIIDRAGRERWVIERSSGTYADDGKLLFVDGFLQDSTAARQAKLEREQLDRKVWDTQKLESLGVLAGGIAHDFNNLLASILGNANLAAMDLPKGSPIHEHITQITEASVRAAELCNQMLAYSGKGRFVVETLDLGTLVEQTAQMLQISISKKAALRFRLKAGLPPVEVDATQIRQVIMNLVINASEAIGDRDGVISLSTGVVRVDRAYIASSLVNADLTLGDYVYLEVADTGCGMSAETVAKIFDPFYSTKFAGRGLGLAAVLGIARGHRGALKVKSELGRGTTFRLLFPAAPRPLEVAEVVPATLEAWRAEGTVLVADDEAAMRKILSRMLRKLGLETVLVADGREAVEVFRKDPDRFALVLLDLTMPHKSGEEAFAEVRRLRPDTPVVLMSGFNAQEAILNYVGNGPPGFLKKPFTVDVLRTTLQGVMS